MTFSQGCMSSTMHSQGCICESLDWDCFTSHFEQYFSCNPYLQVCHIRVSLTCMRQSTSGLSTLPCTSKLVPTTLDWLLLAWPESCLICRSESLKFGCQVLFLLVLSAVYPRGSVSGPFFLSIYASPLANKYLPITILSSTVYRWYFTLYCRILLPHTMFKASKPACFKLHAPVSASTVMY